VNDQHHVARRQVGEGEGDTCDLILEAFATRRAVAGRLAPERGIGFAQFGFDLGMAASGPGAEILLAQPRLRLRRQSKRDGGFHRASRGAGEGRHARGQPRAQGRERRPIGKIGGRFGRVDDAMRPIDRRMPDQPETPFGRHRGVP